MTGSPASGHDPKGAKLLKEFEDFAMRGNVLDMAVGIVLGTSFGGPVISKAD
jgi:large conductance mechanosensitive channel